MIIPDNNVEQVLIVQFHPLALEVVILEFALNGDLRTTDALKVKQAFLLLFYY